MKRTVQKPSSDIKQILGPLVLIGCLILMPSVFLFFFAFKAASNAQLAVRQKLFSLYESQINRGIQDIEETWRNISTETALEGVESNAASTFATFVTEKRCDSLVILNGGEVLYPDTQDASLPLTLFSPPTTPTLNAMDHLERVRNLVSERRPDSAIPILEDLAANPEFSGVRDPQGRLVGPNALLFALEIIDDSTSPVFQRIADSLVVQLNNYESLSIPSSQRLFLMQQVADRLPDGPEFPTLEAEEMAAAFLNDPKNLNGGGFEFHTTSIPGVWSLPDPEGRTIALHRESTLKNRALEVLQDRIPFDGLSVEIVAPGKPATLDDPLIQKQLPSPWTGWQCVMAFENPKQIFEEAGRERILYLVLGMTTIAIILGLGISLLVVFRRQQKLARLKSTLISTVSHELKTPLSSVRMLVDTILEGRCRDENHQREYLELIARENLRLSRLIDNFLTFSRMERNKHAFAFQPVDPRDVVSDALESVRERFDTPHCSLETDMDFHLSLIRGDRDALVTVLLNLLDNAFKYTREEKKIQIRVRNGDGVVRFEVCDNGLGISRRAAKRIFERFYQVDQRMSRSSGGVGLGLSIVQFIIAAHGGSIRVESEFGKGSTFIIDLPAFQTSNSASLPRERQG